MCPAAIRADLPGRPSVLPFLVPQVDSDGNDIGGIRLPEQAVPLGTYADWAFRSEQTGAPDTLIAMAGSFIPFAKTRADREKNHDPRLSIEERYCNRADYVRRVKTRPNNWWRSASCSGRREARSSRPRGSTGIGR